MTTPQAIPSLSPFHAEKELVNGAYELLKLLENHGITDPRTAGICLDLCATYNTALATGGIPGDAEKLSFAALTPLAIMQGLGLATSHVNGHPDYQAIHQAIIIAKGVISFQFNRRLMELPNQQTAGPIQ
jgi:hypothetical protein